METKPKATEALTTLQAIREIKEQISRDIHGMTYEQFKAYLAEDAPVSPEKMFPEKLAKTNEMLRTARLPAKKPRV